MRGPFLCCFFVAACVVGHHGAVCVAPTGERRHKQVRATRTATPPTIDGAIDDPVWARAVADDRFTQKFPDDGGKPSFRTTIQVLYDDREVYFAVHAYDPKPSAIVAQLARRGNTVESDYVSIVLDARHDHDTGLWFWINAAGVIADGQISDDNRTNTNWSGVWRGYSKITRDGWTAELAIPLSILRFSNTHEQQWGFNLTRGVSRKREIIQWVHIPQTEQGNLSRAGHISGISGLDLKRTFELRPFVVMRGASTLPRGGLLGVGSDASLDQALTTGLDLKLGLTNNLTLDATVLPDFGQVEADAVVLNLSTFETRFAEKRPFFLENADIFQTDLRMFYSRRIGGRTTGLVPGSTVKAEDGTTLQVTDAPLAVPIWAAGRVSGKIGSRFTVAALDALTGPESVTAVDGNGVARTVEPTAARNYGALRGKYSLGGSSYLGFIATSLTRLGEVDQPSADHDAYAEALDGRWVASDGAYRAYFMLGASHRVGGPRYTDAGQVDAGGAPCSDATCSRISRADGTRQSPGDTGVAGETGGGKVGGDHWLFWGNYRFASPHFDVNDVGFESDWDYHRTYLQATYREREPFSRFQNGSIRLSFNGTLGFDGLRKENVFTLFGQTLTRQFWGQSVYLGYRPRGTWTTRETSDGARFERSDWMFGGIVLASDSRRKMTGRIGLDMGASTIDNTRSLGLNASLDMRVIAPLEVSMSGNAGVLLDSLRYVSCADAAGDACSLRSASRDYLMARLDTGQMSLTLRGTWALSTTLALQVYSQLFAARGRYHDYGAMLRQLGGRPFLGRSDLSATTYTGDRDGDGIKDDDFEFATLNANVVMRWEPTPGTTLIGVYTRSQNGAVDLAGASPALSFSSLRRGGVAEVVLVKLTLFYD